MNWLLFVLLAEFCWIGLAANEDPLKQIREAYDKLSSKTQHYYDVRLGPSRTLAKSKPELIKWYAAIHHNFTQTEIYDLLEFTFSKIVENYEGSKEGREFLKFYFAQISKMQNDSDAAYDKFVDAVRPEWKKLDQKEKTELEEKLGSFGEVFGESERDEKVSNAPPFSIPPNQLDAFTAYYKNATARQEDRIRVAAKMHKKDPLLYKFAKTLFENEVSKFSGGEKLREFLIKIYLYADEMESDSDQEYRKFVEKVNSEWSKLSLETQLLFVSHFGFFDGIIKG